MKEAQNEMMNAQMGRQLNMQSAMREKQMCFQVAMARQRFWVAILCEKISLIFPVLPTFCKWCCVWLYCWRDQNKEATACCSHMAYRHCVLFSI